jgi:hypothetical protein
VSGQAGRRSPQEAAALSLFHRMSTEYGVLRTNRRSLPTTYEVCYLLCVLFSFPCLTLSCWLYYIFIFATVLLHTCPATRVGSWPASALHGGEVQCSDTRQRRDLGERTAVDEKGKRERGRGRGQRAWATGVGNGRETLSRGQEGLVGLGNEKKSGAHAA